MDHLTGGKWLKPVTNELHGNTGLILGLRSANERGLYKVTPSLIGWAQTYNQPCKISDRVVRKESPWTRADG